MTENIQKRFINHATVAAYLGVIVEKMKKDSFSPDLVVGLSRGGLTPGVMLSHFLGKPFVPFQTALRDHPAWNTDTEEFKTIEKVIIIDDICDTGDTFKKLKLELDKKFPSIDIRFACLHYNRPCNFPIDWYGTFIDKEKHDQWIVYPWEDWWERDAVESSIVNDIIGRLPT